MELWIRSQDRTNLVKVDNVYVDENRIEANFKKYYGGWNYFVLGTYKTKEKALKVLDEIQNLINPKIIIKQGKPLVKTVDGTVYREPDEVEIKELSVVFYQMPEE